MRNVLAILVLVGCGRMNFDVVEDAGIDPDLLGDPRSCRAAQRRGLATGITTVDPDRDGPMPPREVWCDQDRSGGGWTLALDVDGTQPTFDHASPLWTDATLLSPGKLDPNVPGEAKLLPYVDHPVAEILLVAESTREVVVAARGASLRQMLAAGLTIPTYTPVGQWRGAFAGSSLATGCVRQGLHLIDQPDTNAPGSVRIGVHGAPTPVDCRAPTSAFGLGLDIPCPDASLLAAGAVATQGDGGAGCLPMQVEVYVRDDDQTHLTATETCAEHLAAGRTADGIYLVGEPATPRRCDMTTDGGGWTNVVDLDSTRDPCPAGWSLSPMAPVCVAPTDQILTAAAVFDAPTASYRSVMVETSALQYGTSDAFSGGQSIDGVYVDGLSITLGSPRQHVATYAAGFTDNAAEGCGGGLACSCPCFGGIAGVPPPFVATMAYRCEAGVVGSPAEVVYRIDPLFDGVEVPTACEQEASPVPIITTLALPTSEPIEARLLRDEVPPTMSAEGLAVHRLEIWVR